MNRSVFKKIVDDYYSQLPQCKFVLAVDFDATLCYSHYPKCGKETPICDFIRSVQDLDIVIILTTCRENNSLALALDWCKAHNIRIDYANENDPNRVKLYKNCRKIYCDMLIDDTSYNFNMNDFVVDK